MNEFIPKPEIKSYEEDNEQDIKDLDKVQSEDL